MLIVVVLLGLLFGVVRFCPNFPCSADSATVVMSCDLIAAVLSLGVGPIVIVETPWNSVWCVFGGLAGLSGA